MGWISEADVARTRALIRAAGLPDVAPDLGVDTYLEYMGHDKKVEGGKMRFGLLKKLGEAEVSLEQMAALLHPVYKVRVVDCNAERMGWSEFTKLLDKYQPKYYLSQLTAPTLENDMYGCFLAKARGARTIVFGTHVTPIPRETMRSFPSLDYALVGEPDLTIRDLLDHREGKIEQRSPEIRHLYDTQDPTYKPAINPDGSLDMYGIKGLAWRKGEEIVVNFPRPFLADLDDMPIPMHELLPLVKYRMPLIKGPFTFIATSRGCTAGCTYCIKHVSYQYSVRVRSPKLIMQELWSLKKLGINWIQNVYLVRRAGRGGQ